MGGGNPYEHAHINGALSDMFGDWDTESSDYGNWEEYTDAYASVNAQAMQKSSVMQIKRLNPGATSLDKMPCSASTSAICGKETELCKGMFSAGSDQRVNNAEPFRGAEIVKNPGLSKRAFSASCDARMCSLTEKANYSTQPSQSCFQSSPLDYHGALQAFLPSSPNPTIFQLLEIVADKQDLSFVQKVQVAEGQIAKLCNAFVASSATVQHAKITNLDFKALDAESANVVGFYGNKAIMAEVFRKEGVAPLEFIASMVANQLTPGLYASFCGDNGKVCLFYWGENQGPTHEANRKDVSCNFIRYLVELCRIVYVCVDGKTMEESVVYSATGFPTRRQRTQRLQIAIRKESDNDLKLLKGFEIMLPGTVSCGKIGFQLSQGRHRCIVVTSALNPLKVVSRAGFKTGTVDELKAFLTSNFYDFSIDCTNLPDADFLLLLKMLGKQEELVRYRDAEREWQKRGDESAKKLQSLEIVLKTKRDELMNTFKQALDCYLQHKYPWEENLVNAPEKKEESNSEQTHESFTRALLHFECELCGIWSDQHSPDQRFLYAGSQIEVVSLQGNDTGSSCNPEFFSIKAGASGNIKAVASPICFGQEVILFGGSNTTADRNCSQELKAHFSRPNDDEPFSNRDPIVLNGYTKLKVTVTQNKKRSDLVSVKLLDSEVSRLEAWLHAFCDGKPLSLLKKAKAASCFIDENDKKPLDKKLLEKLLKEESIKAWAMRLSDEASSSLIERLLWEGKDKPISIHDQATATCAKIYKEARLKVFTELDAFMKKEILASLRKRVQTVLKEESDSVMRDLEIEKKRLVSGLKSCTQLFVPLADVHQDKRLKLCLKEIKEQRGGFGPFINFSTKLTIKYSHEEQEPETLTWRAAEIMPEKGDLDELLKAPGRVITPKCNSTADLFTLNPKLQRLSRVVCLKSGKVLVFVEANDRSYLRVYHCPRLGVSIEGRDPIKEFKRGLDLWAFDELSRFVAMYDRNAHTINAFRLDESFQHMDFAGVDIQLSQYSGSSNIVWMEAVPGKREILLIDDQNKLRICELTACMMRPRSVTLPYTFIKACVTPDASCLIVFSNPGGSQEGNNDDIDRPDAVDKEDSNYSVSAYVYLLDDSLTLLKCVSLDSMNEKGVEHVHAECKYFGSQMHLVFLSCKDDKLVLKSYVLEISSAQQTFQLQKVNHDLFQDPRDSGVDQKAQSSNSPALDYIFHIFDKYATSPPLCSAGRSVRLCILLNPPCSMWMSNKAERNCQEHIASSLQLLKEKGKVFTEALKLHVSTETLEDTWCLNESSSSEPSATCPWVPNFMGEWIQKLLCLIPLQIARAENNTLKPLVNGLQIPVDADYSDAVSLASLLRFGLYDQVLASWKGEVKVISSMGKQSSGKSYLLNHLAGGLLDVAGGRCTDGVWMTLRCELDCLYVLLDFEGLGSFERSEQEDMLLSILNAAISNITIFNKKDFHLDKETEAIFQRFQDGVSLVKADEKLFKGLFYIAIKDVDASDVEDLKAEFFTKINYMCSKPANFLTTMYGGEVELAALPPFQRAEFQQSIADIGSTIREIKASYNSGQQFLVDLKLLIAQISARDWSPVESKRLIMRLSILRKHLKTAIRLGQSCDGQCLLDFDKQEAIVDGLICMEGTTLEGIKDAGLELACAADDNKSTQIIMEPLRQAFVSVIAHCQVRDDDVKRHGSYERFLTSLVERRMKRVLEWLQVNTQAFQHDTDVQKLILEATAKLADMKDKFLLCSCKCNDCFLRCMREKGHQSEHSCLGSHACMHQCSYCEEDRNCDCIILDCHDLAGHDGPHNCKQKTHTCGKPCCFFGMSSNCNQLCSLRVDHEGEHRCNSRQHMCKEKCSLLHCSNVCALPFELGDHSTHACHEKFCPIKCSMNGCTRQCATQDHLHDLKADAEHFCANEHPCTSKCMSPGICHVHTELLKHTRSFHGKRSDFEYDYVSEQFEERKGCCIMISPFQRHHEGDHMHSTKANVVHFCDTKCPACDYYCQLPYGHAGLHKTVHGNMRKMKFVSEVEEIDLLDRKYTRGESGVAEMCMMHCKARGRGHTHLTPCPEYRGSGCCTEKLLEGVRHSKIVCPGLDVDVPLDEMTHEAYWQYIRFVDPCEESERESFALCDHFCLSEEHTQGADVGKSHCTEKLWHAPVSLAGTFQTGSGGYVTEDGHHFTCDHSMVLSQSVIFVIDKSASMNSTDIKPTLTKFTGHMNRLGCVFEAVVRFIRTRINTIKGLPMKDLVSVILFDTVGYEAVKLDAMSEQIVNKLLNYRASGATTYSSGLRMVGQILGESHGQPEIEKKGPVVIFLSDGGNNGGVDPVYMVQKLKQAEPKLVLHTIMFGHSPDSAILQKMAQAGDGTFQFSLDEVQLARTFEGLAKSLKPKLAALCRTLA